MMSDRIIRDLVPPELGPSGCGLYPDESQCQQMWARLLGPGRTCRAVWPLVGPKWPHSSPTSCSRLPVARSAHGATVYNDKLWIFAGYDGNAR